MKGDGAEGGGRGRRRRLKAARERGAEVRWLRELEEEEQG